MAPTFTGCCYCRERAGHQTVFVRINAKLGWAWASGSSGEGAAEADGVHLRRGHDAPMDEQAVSAGSCPSAQVNNYGSELAAGGIAEEHGPSAEIMESAEC